MSTSKDVYRLEFGADFDPEFNAEFDADFDTKFGADLNDSITNSRLKSARNLM